jgi:hypothetical protein
MDRIDLDEDIEIETNSALKPLDLARFAPTTRFQVKKVSNLDHAKKTALAKEISQLWGKPIPRIMKLIKDYEYQETFDAFEQTKKAEDVRIPWGLFLWKLKNPPGKK